MSEPGALPGRRAESPIGVLEVVLLALAAGTGLALRAWHLGDVGLTHFDEGVYAFTGLGVADPSQPRRFFPDQQKFSPPVYFSLVALANLLGLSPERSPFVVNVVMGTITIPAVWALTRRWFGPIAAAATAWLVALSEFHVLMSRSALTDVTFALAFLVASGAVLVALERGTRGSAVLAGVLVGVAWNTKYHGWFALVVGAMVIAAQWRLQHADSAWLRHAVRQWLLMCVVAALCYLPWSLYIQSQAAGSSGWAAYFATMLGLDWFASFWRQVQQQAWLEGPWSRASVPLAIGAAQLVALRTTAALPLWVLPVGCVAALLVGSAGSALALGLMALWQSWRRGMTGASWFLGGVLALWFVMAPIYNPYFRLLLPFTLATFVLAGHGLAILHGPARTGRGARVAAASLAGTLLVVVVALRLDDPSDPWRPTRGLPAAAAAIDSAIPPGVPVSVLGEPALAFYLHQRGHPSFERTALEALDSLSEDRLVVAGIYLRRAPRLRERFRARGDRFELLGRFSAGRPSDLRLLDDFKPDTAARWVVTPDSTYDLLLYRLSPRPGNAP